MPENSAIRFIKMYDQYYEQTVKELHSGSDSIFFDVKSPFNFLSLKKSLLIDDKHSHSGLFFRNKYNYHTIIDPSESSLKWF